MKSKKEKKINQDCRTIETYKIKRFCPLSWIALRALFICFWTSIDNKSFLSNWINYHHQVVCDNDKSKTYKYPWTINNRDWNSFLFSRTCITWIRFFFFQSKDIFVCSLSFKGMCAWNRSIAYMIKNEV